MVNMWKIFKKRLPFFLMENGIIFICVRKFFFHSTGSISKCSPYIVCCEKHGPFVSAKQNTVCCFCYQTDMYISAKFPATGNKCTAHLGRWLYCIKTKFNFSGRFFQIFCAKTSPIWTQVYPNRAQGLNTNMDMQ